MKLSEIRPCDLCGGKISPNFYVLRFSVAFFSPSTRQVLAMTDYFNGNLALGEMFSGDEDVVKVAMDDREHGKQLTDEVFLCQECYMMKKISLPELAEKIHDRRKEKEEIDTDES